MMFVHLIPIGIFVLCSLVVMFVHLIPRGIYVTFLGSNVCIFNS